jgi:tRNA-(ms[2]io[6]A)-hydroxylase
MVSEAGHYRVFLDLAYLYAETDYVKNRWQAIISGEAAIMKNMELRGDRVH